MSGPGPIAGRRDFGGWPLAALAGAALLAGAVPLYGADWLAALHREFGWSRQQLSLPWDITRYGLPWLAAPFITGYLSDRIGPRPVVVAGLFAIAGAWALFGLAQSLGMYYGAFVLREAGAYLGGWVPVTAILCRRFARRRATAIAAASVIAPTGAMALAPFIAWGANPAVGGMGWQLTALAVSGGALLVAAAAFARLPRRPAATDPSPDGDARAPQRARSTPQALRSCPFWYIVIGGALAASGVLGFSSIIYWMAPDNDFTPSELGNILSIQSYVSIIFYLAGGIAGDRIAKHKAMALFALMQAAGMAAPVLVGGLPGLYLCTILLGMGTGGLYPLSAAIIADYFGMDSFGKILGLFILLSGLLTLLSENAAVLIYNALGGYAITFPLLAAHSLIAAFLFLKARPPRRNSGDARGISPSPRPTPPPPTTPQ